MYLAWGHTFWLILLSYVGVGPVSDSSDSEVTQSCPTLCDPMDCSLSGSSVHGIFQARILEWVAVSFSRGSSQPKDRTRVSCIASRRFTVWATRWVSGKTSFCQCRSQRRCRFDPSVKDTLEEEVTILFSVLAQRMSWTGGAWQATFHEVAESDMTEELSIHVKTQ